jgi:hypothetical protein
MDLFVHCERTLKIPDTRAGGKGGLAKLSGRAKYQLRNLSEPAGKPLERAGGSLERPGGSLEPVGKPLEPGFRASRSYKQCICSMLRIKNCFSRVFPDDFSLVACSLGGMFVQCWTLAVERWTFVSALNKQEEL